MLKSLTLTATWLSAASVGQALAAEPPAEVSIPGSRVFPESLTSGPDGSLFIGSIGARTIFRAPPGASAAEAWIQPGTDGLASIFGVFADAKSQTLWACSNTFGGPPGTPPSQPAMLYAFDMKSGLSKQHYALPTPGAFCNDIAVGADGTVYASDTNNMQVVRLRRGSSMLELWAGKNGEFGPKGGVVDGISVLGNRVLVNTLVTSKLFSVPILANGDAGTIVEVKLERPIERPDGMRSFGKDGLLVVEGGSGGRLSRVTLHGDAGQVTSLKEGYPDGPVAVTVVGKTAYVLEGQLASLRSAPDTPTKPFHATSVSVGVP